MMGLRGKYQKATFLVKRNVVWGNFRYINIQCVCGGAGRALGSLVKNISSDGHGPNSLENSGVD
jgi:hypothetical protein